MIRPTKIDVLIKLLIKKGVFTKEEFKAQEGEMILELNEYIRIRRDKLEGRTERKE